jgi:hypothetical protein
MKRTNTFILTPSKEEEAIRKMDEEKIAEVKLYRNGQEVQFYNEGDVAKALIEVGGEIYQYSIVSDPALMKHER